MHYWIVYYQIDICACPNRHMLSNISAPADHAGYLAAPCATIGSAIVREIIKTNEGRDTTHR
jgi:hypothetical protein